MEIGGLFTALLVGAVIGGLGRLVVPGRQHVSLLMTVLVGIAAALLGTAAATVLGVAHTAGIDWIELALQVGLAGAVAALVAREQLGDGQARDRPVEVVSRHVGQQPAQKRQVEGAAQQGGEGEPAQGHGRRES